MNQIIDYISLGLQKGLIKFDEDQKTITYIHQNKKRNYTNPEGKVQALTFLKLVLHYGYKAERIQQFVSVTMGSDTKKEADIVVYNDDECDEPYILVECKKSDVSEQESIQAIDQAYSYAYALAPNIRYVWVTSGLRNEYYEVDKVSQIRIEHPDIPQFGVNKLENYKFVYDASALKQEVGKETFSDIRVIDEDLLTKQFKKAHCLFENYA